VRLRFRPRNELDSPESHRPVSDRKHAPSSGLTDTWPETPAAAKTQARFELELEDWQKSGE
jgi:hypothetical protein